jgi:hypothetical protein
MSHPERQSEPPRGKDTERSWGEVAREFLPPALIFYGMCMIGSGLVNGFHGVVVIVGVVILGAGLLARSRSKKSPTG